jgi:hydrogenase-1 operon protein HyaF
MSTRADTGRPFPIPVVAFGPGSQPDEDGTLDCLSLPQGMDTYRPPARPEPEDLDGRAAAQGALQAIRDALALAAGGGEAAAVDLAGLPAADRRLVDQVLGEGEVSIQLLGDDGDPVLRIQEAVFAGIWRLLGHDAQGRAVDRVEVGPLPAIVRATAALDGARARRVDAPAPAGVLNATPVLVELAEQRQAWRPARAPHVVNLSLLPMAPQDIAWLDHVLGTGRVRMLSRGYGNCRITDCEVPRTWRVVYYNSQDAVILNTVEVTDLPEVACAAAQDLQDSLARLREVLAWVDGT